MKRTDKTQSRFRRLKELLAGNSTMLIVMQDNPDPDSIAAAVALRKLANNIGEIPCTIVHGGTVGRGENRALVQYLSLRLRQCRKVDFTKFDIVAIVDTQPTAGNNSLPAGFLPDIVFDHHPCRHATRNAKFTDVRTKYGATSTILLEYLEAAKIMPDMPLATAMLYAVRSDTQDLGREATAADIRAIGILYPLANKRMLSEIQRGAVPTEYFKMLSQALQNAYICGGAIYTTLGRIDNPDMIGELADLLLREENTTWTMCSAVFDDKLLLSIRTSQGETDAGKIIKHIVGRKGTAGGHLTYAGGQIPLTDCNSFSVTKLQAKLAEKFLKTIGIDPAARTKLVN